MVKSARFWILSSSVWVHFHSPNTCISVTFRTDFTKPYSQHCHGGLQDCQNSITCSAPVKGRTDKHSNLYHLTLKFVKKEKTICISNQNLLILIELYNFTMKRMLSSQTMYRRLLSPTLATQEPKTFTNTPLKYQFQFDPDTVDSKSH